MNSASSPRSLTFTWEYVRRVPMVLGAFVLLSLAAHVATFFLFQVVYPPQMTLTAPPPPITILDPSRPDHQALLRWADAEGPAPAGSGPDVLSEQLLETSYRPSFATLHTPLLKLPETASPTQYPPARDPLAIIRSAEPRPSVAIASKATLPTRVVFSGTLAVPEMRIDLAMRNATELEPATFLIGVTERGEIRFVVPQHSSGSPTMDAAASQALSHLKLQPSTAPVTWTTATIEWGPDAFAQVSNINPVAPARTPDAGAHSPSAIRNKN